MPIRTIEDAIAWRKQLTPVIENLDDASAIKSKMLYPIWNVDTAYEEDKHRVRRTIEGGDILFKCKQSHTSQYGWEPENAPALWVAINETNAGTIEDPIPAARGMEYEYGKYYLDGEDSNIYLCERSGETGTVVLQFMPHELVGHYFTLA